VSDADQLAAEIVYRASLYVDALIDAARKGDRQKAEELNRHIHEQISHGLPLDPGLAGYLARQDLSKPGKRAKVDYATRDLALAAAVEILIEQKKPWKVAIAEVKALANVSTATVRAAQTECGQEVRAALGDPEKRPLMIAVADYALNPQNYGSNRLLPQR
jgi:hypothetical protein